MKKRIKNEELIRKLLQAPMKEFDKNAIFDKALKKALAPRRGRPRRVYHKPFYEE